MKIKAGVMGSANDTLPEGVSSQLRERAESLGRVIGERDLILLTGGTTGLPYLVGREARRFGAFHIGISPATNEEDHTGKYGLPVDACDVLIYTGFGLKGRNVVLVRSCDIVLFIGGSIGSLNEFTIAHDEARIVGCLEGTGGTADEIPRLLTKLHKLTGVRVLVESDPAALVSSCLEELGKSRS